MNLIYAPRTQAPALRYCLPACPPRICEDVALPVDHSELLEIVARAFQGIKQRTVSASSPQRRLNIIEGFRVLAENVQMTGEHPDLRRLAQAFT
jgi:hypothetical protein